MRSMTGPCRAWQAAIHPRLELDGSYFVAVVLQE